MKTVSKVILIVLLKLISLSLSAQEVKYANILQPSGEVHISVSYSTVDHVFAEGQGICFSLKNLTNNDLYCSFDLVAVTTCGNEVVANHYSSVKAGATFKSSQTGGYGEMWGGQQSVSKKECAGEKITYTADGQTKTGINRIARFEIRNFTSKIIHLPKTDTNNPNSKAVKANGTVTNASDDEKLNQALMEKMEKDFDENKKQKKSSENANSSNTSTSLVKEGQKSNTAINNAKSTNKHDPEITKKIQEYKQFIINTLNWHEYNALDNSNNIFKTKLTNCKWNGNSFSWTETKYMSSSYGGVYSNNFENNLDRCTNECTIEESTFNGTISNSQAKLWFLKNTRFQSGFASNDEPFLERLQEAFDYIIANKNN